MPILMKAEIHGQSQHGYQETFDALAPLYRVSSGFIAHASHPIDGGWCVIDLWSSREDFQRFYSQHVAHRLSAAVRPRIAFRPLHDALVQGRACHFARPADPRRFGAVGAQRCGSDLSMRLLGCVNGHWSTPLE